MESHSNAYTWFLPNDKAIESYIQRLGYDATTQEAVAAIENCLMNQYIENTTQYKVLMGEFKTMNEAESYRKLLKNNHQIDAIIY